MKPRDVVEGRVYLIRRSCILSQKLFDPSNARQRRVVRFCLSAAARKYGVQLISARLDSTELELIVGDPDARRPDFMRDACRWISGCMATLLDRTGPFWQPEPYSCTWLQDVETVVDACAVLSVDCRDDEKLDEDGWPVGLLFRPEDFGRRVRSRRPTVYFSRTRSALPDRVSAPLRPPGDHDRPSWIELLNRRIEARRSEIAELEPERPDEDTLTPRTGPPLIAPVGHCTNAVAGRDGDAVAAAVRARQRFQVQYASRLVKWCNGDRWVTFPFGTWWMRVFHQAACAQSPGGSTSTPPHAPP